MAEEFGIVKTIIGSVVVTSSNGAQRILQAGDKVYPGEILQTGLLGAIEVSLPNGDSIDLGRNSNVTLDIADFSGLAVESSEATLADVVALQEALMEGLDPSLIFDPTAAGATSEPPNQPLRSVKIDHIAPVTLPDAGFDTTAIDLLLSAEAQRNGQEIQHIPPTLDVTLNAGQRGPFLSSLDPRDPTDTESSDSGLFSALFTVAADNNIQPPSLAYSLSTLNAITKLTSDGEVVVLTQDNGVIEGSTLTTLVFSISVNALTGEVSLNQFAALDHPSEALGGSSFNNSSAALGLSRGNVLLTASGVVSGNAGATAADHQSVDISTVFSFTDDVPNAHDDAHVISEDSLISIDANVTDNDSFNADGGQFDSWHDASANYGTFLDLGNGQYRYTLNSSQPDVAQLNDGDHLLESFEYTIVDGDGDKSTATLTISINGTNDAPEVSDKFVDLNPNADAVNISLAAYGDGGAKDVEDDADNTNGGNAITNIQLESIPESGMLLVNGLEVQVGSVFSETTTFDFIADYADPVLFGTKNDAGSRSDWGKFESDGTISLSAGDIIGVVSGARDGSQATDVGFQSGGIATHDGTGIGVKGKDGSQIDLTNHEALTIRFSEPVANGEVGLSSVGGYFLPGSESQPDATAQWVASLDGHVVAQGAERQDPFDDGNANTAVIHVDVAFDSIEFTVEANVNANYSIQYIEVNTIFEDSFTYSAVDSDGLASLDIATVTLSGSASNFSPDAMNDYGEKQLRGMEDTTLTIDAATLLANDMDSNGDALTIIAVNNAAHGVVLLNANGSLSFTPTSNYSGPASFDYTVTDGHGGNSSATATLNILPVADAPNLFISIGEAVVEANHQAITGDNVADTDNGFTVTAYDINGDHSSVSVVSGTSHDGFGVTGRASGANSELGSNSTGSERLEVKFDHTVESVDVAFAWLSSVETAVFTFYRGDTQVGAAGSVRFQSDSVDSGFTLSPGADFDRIDFTAPLNGLDDYLINSISFNKVSSYSYNVNVQADLTDLDGSEVLGGVTLNYLLEGVSVIGIANPDGTYSPNGLMLTSDHLLSGEEINSILGSVISRDGSAVTVTQANAKVVAEQIDDHIDFTALSLKGWAGYQDSAPEAATTINANLLNLSGNSWKAAALTDLGVGSDFDWSNGVLTFEAKIDVQGELQGILFEHNLQNNHTADQANLVKVSGSQVWGRNAEFNSDDLGDGWMKIDVDLSLLDQSSGVFTNIVFVNDDDNEVNGTGDISFRNLSISDEGINSPPITETALLLEGDSAHNDLIAGSGDDVVFGGGGDDILTGGQGQDHFVWNKSDLGTAQTPSHDTVTDFNPDEDILNLTDLLSDGSHTIEGVDVNDHLRVSIKDETGQTVQEIDLNGVAITLDATSTLDSLLSSGAIHDGI